MTKGFHNWKKCSKRFLDHQNSVIHMDYYSLGGFHVANVDTYEKFRDQLPLEKAENCQIWLTILHNVQLGRQGLTFRGNSDKGNFDQLMQFSTKIEPHVSKWLEKKRNKYVHNDYQNESIRIMAFFLIHDIASNINERHYYFIVADKVTGSSNVERLVLCFRWVDADLSRGLCWDTCHRKHEV